MMTVKILATLFVTMQIVFLGALKLVDSRFQPTKADKVVLPIGFLITYIVIWM